MLIETGQWLIGEVTNIIRIAKERGLSPEEKLQAAELKARLNSWKRDFDKLISH